MEMATMASSALLFGGVGIVALCDVPWRGVAFPLPPELSISAPLPDIPTAHPLALCVASLILAVVVTAVLPRIGALADLFTLPLPLRLPRTPNTPPPDPRTTLAPPSTLLLALPPLIWALIPLTAPLHAALAAAPPPPNLTIPLALLDVLLVAAYVTPWHMDAPAHVFAAAAFAVLVAAARLALLAVAVWLPAAATLVGSVFLGALLYGAYKAGAGTFVAALANVAMGGPGHVATVMGNVMAVLGLLTAAVRHLVFTFHLAEIFAVYGTAVVAVHAYAMADMLPSTAFVAVAVCNGLGATMFRYAAGLALMWLAACVTFKVLERLFIPAALLRAAADGVEFPALTHASRSRNIATTVCYVGLFFRSFENPQAKNKVMSDMVVFTVIVLLNVLSQIAGIASAALLLTAPSLESRLQHARVILFFLLTAAVDVGLLTAFAISARSGALGGVVAIGLLHLLDSVVRSLVHLFKSFVLYVIHLRASAATTDTYVFYTELTANTVELGIKAIVLVGNFAASPGLDSTKMLLALYAFNTYNSMKANWEAFKTRQHTVALFDSLVPDATQAQIDAHDDVCAFCWDDMELGSAKFTRCAHVFHAGCLRKWLLVHTTCPKCRAPVLETDDQ